MSDILREIRVDLWGAINEYAASCGADPSKHVYGNTTRMCAVSGVERILRDHLERVEAERDRSNKLIDDVCQLLRDSGAKGHHLAALVCDLRDKRDRLRETTRSNPMLIDWQPIRTAPDQERVLVWCQDRKRPLIAVKRRSGWVYASGRLKTGYSLIDACGIAAREFGMTERAEFRLHCRPTHWARLPTNAPHGVYDDNGETTDAD